MSTIIHVYTPAVFGILFQNHEGLVNGTICYLFVSYLAIKEPLSS